MYRCIDNSVALRRNADDIARAVHAGELWRADIRAATRGISLQNKDGESVLQLDRSDGKVEYRYSENVIYRRVGLGSWTRILEPIKASSMQRDARTNAIAWRWELELQPKAHGSFKPGSVRPLFTFLAVPSIPATP